PAEEHRRGNNLGQVRRMQDRLLLRSMSTRRRQGQHQCRKHQRGNPARGPKDFHGTSPDTKRIGMSINLPIDKRAAFIRPPRRNLGPLHSPKEKLCVPERPALTLPAVHSPQPVHTNGRSRSEEHTSELQSLAYLVCRLLLEKKKK